MYDGELRVGKVLIWCADNRMLRHAVVITKVGSGRVWSRRLGSRVDSGDTMTLEDVFRRDTTDEGSPDVHPVHGGRLPPAGVTRFVFNGKLEPTKPTSIQLTPSRSEEATDGEC